MAGSVREKAPGRWELRVYLGTDPTTGRRRWASRSVQAKNRRAAERALAAYVTELDQGTTIPGDGSTFGDLVDRWIALKGDTWSPATLREHRRIADTYLTPLRSTPVRKLRTVTLDALYADLRARGGHKRRPLDPASVRRIHVVVRAALEQAVRWELIARNPAALADPGTADHLEATPPTVAELAKLLRAAEDGAPGLAVFMVVAAVTGARRGAMCALRWSDIDLEHQVVGFPRVLTIGPDGPVERPASKRKASARRAALDPITVGALMAHHDVMAKRAADLGVALAPDAFVFSDRPACDKPWRPDSTSRRFARARKAAGIPDGVRLHDLRHFMATLALASGADAKTVASRGGWRQAATMFDTYAHVLEPNDRAVAEVLGRAVHGDPA